MKVLAVSTSRADWGLLAPVVAELRRRRCFDVKLALTGQHLAPESNSLNLIQAEGATIDYTVEMGTHDDSPPALANAMGAAAAGIGKTIAQARPDLMLVLGDRYEMLSVVSAAVVARVPVAHLCGGDITEGAIDDSLRHAITKLSSLHFVTNSDAARRVAQLGEPADRIFDVGSPGLDRIEECPVMDRPTLLADLGLPDCSRFFVVTYHPATLSTDTLLGCRSMLDALDRFPEIGLIFTGSNADPGAREIDAAVREYASQRANAVFHETLGSRRYFSALSHGDAVVGNSSSGLYEAPSFKVPTVNIGDRQKGRLRATSVIDCSDDVDEIEKAIREAIRMDCSEVLNPYGDGMAAKKIANILENLVEPALLIQKTFVDWR